MKLSTTVRYGARAIAQLAASPDGPVSVREIARQQLISAKYLEHILKTLKVGGIVEAVHGKRGGYVLAKSPESITLKDLYDVLEGSPAPVACVDCPETCGMQDLCPTRDTWVELKEAITAVLERTTVRDLADRQHQKALAAVPDYQI
jgi:Rrf2 family protein